MTPEEVTKTQEILRAWEGNSPADLADQLNLTIPGDWQTESRFIDRTFIVTLQLRNAIGAWVRQDGVGDSWSSAFLAAARLHGIGRAIQSGQGVVVAAQPVQYVAPAAPPSQPAAAPTYQPAPPIAPGTAGLCPIHGLAWTIQPGGVSKRTNKPYRGFYKCAGKNADNSYCDQKPADEWVAAHPLA